MNLHFIIYLPEVVEANPTKDAFLHLQCSGEHVTPYLTEAPTGSIALKWYEGKGYCYKFEKIREGSGDEAWKSLSRDDITIPNIVKAYAMVNNLPL